MYIIFHMLLCLSISFIYISASPSVSTSPAHLYQISEAHWKLAREEVWKDRNSTQSLQNVLFSGAGMLRRRKKSTTLFFFFLCSSITFTNYFPPFTWLWPHSCFWQMEKHRQAAANQVPPKPASLAPASQAQAAAKASWFLHNEQKSPLTCLRIASIFLTLALETVSEAWGKKSCRKSSAFQCPRGSGGVG